MRPDDDDFAAIVIAQQFQLVDETGNSVADFGPATINGVPGDALLFHHNLFTDSYLGWTRAGFGFDNYVELHGPTQSETHLLMSGDGIGHGVTELYGGNSTVFLQDTAVDIQTNDAGGNIGIVAGSATGAVNVQAGAGFNVAAGQGGSGDVLIGTTANSQLIAGNNVNLRPSNRLVLGTSRAAFLPLGKQSVYLAGIATPAYLAFLVGAQTIGIQGIDGDQVTMTYSFSHQSNGVPAANFRATFQVFGPLGNIVFSDLMFGQQAVPDYRQMSCQFNYTLNLGSGGYTFAVVGGLQSGTGTQYYQSFSIDHAGIR